MKRTACLWGLAAVGLWMAVATAAQPQLLPCSERPTAIDKPWTNVYVVPCLEELALDGAGEALRFATLAAGPDGALYAARPLYGEILRLSDRDADGLPDRTEVWASGLPLLTGMAFDDASLYAVAGARLVRVDAGVVTTLRDDLPVEPGLWAGGLAVGRLTGEPAPRVYIGIRPTCADCAEDVRRRGGIVSTTLDGDDLRIEAVGVYAPADMAIVNGRLWLVDSAPLPAPQGALLDELNSLSTGADFGYPGCLGADTPAVPGGCAGTTPPERVFPAGSQPASLLLYAGSALENLQGQLLLALGGTSGGLNLTGYQLLLLDRAHPDVPPTVLMPFASSIDPALSALTPEQLNWRGVGLYPWRPLDLAETREGWVYISLAGGRILALRPQAEETS